MASVSRGIVNPDDRSGARVMMGTI